MKVSFSRPSNIPSKFHVQNRNRNRTSFKTTARKVRYCLQENRVITQICRSVALHSLGLRTCLIELILTSVLCKY